MEAQAQSIKMEAPTYDATYEAQDYQPIPQEAERTYEETAIQTTPGTELQAQPSASEQMPLPPELYKIAKYEQKKQYYTGKKLEKYEKKQLKKQQKINDKLLRLDKKDKKGKDTEAKREALQSKLERYRLDKELTVQKRIAKRQDNWNKKETKQVKAILKQKDQLTGLRERTAEGSVSPAIALLREAYIAQQSHTAHYPALTHA